MDRLTQLRGRAEGSQDSKLDNSNAPSEAYMTANESSKYFSLSEEDSTFDISPIKDVSLASPASVEKSIAENDQLISNLSPTSKKTDLLDSYKFTKQIEAANILSGGVDIFDDNDNSYDGDELVIDDNVDLDEKSNSEVKLGENPDTNFQKTDELIEPLDNDPDVASKDSEVVLQIDGKNVNAIDIGNGLYLYRKAGEEELAAVQIVADDNDQPSFKFLKVRENNEGNLEVYEEIEIEVPKEVPVKDENTKNVPVPIKDIKKAISSSASNKVVKKPQQDIISSTSSSARESDDSVKLNNSENTVETNLNGKMMKFNETRKSPVIHSTPNKEGIPLTKTMVDLQLHPNRQLDKVKTIEVHTDTNKQKATETLTKSKQSLDDSKSEKELEKSLKPTEPSEIQKKIEDNATLTNAPDENMKTKTSNNEKADKMQSQINVTLETVEDKDQVKTNPNEPEKSNIVDKTKVMTIADKNCTLNPESKCIVDSSLSKSNVLEETARISTKCTETTNVLSEKRDDGNQIDLSETKSNDLKFCGTATTSYPSSDSKNIDLKLKDSIHDSDRNSKIDTSVETLTSQQPNTVGHKIVEGKETTQNNCTTKSTEDNTQVVTSTTANKAATNSNKDQNTESIFKLESKTENESLSLEISTKFLSHKKSEKETKLNEIRENASALPTNLKPKGSVVSNEVTKDIVSSSDACKNKIDLKNESKTQADVKERYVKTVPSHEVKNEIKAIGPLINSNTTERLKITDLKTCQKSVENINLQNIENKSNKIMQNIVKPTNLANVDAKPALSKNDHFKNIDLVNNANKIDQKPMEKDEKQLKKTNSFVPQIVPMNLKGLPTKDDPKIINILKIETVKPQQVFSKSEPNKPQGEELQKHQEAKKEPISITLHKKPVNVNAAVPFGKWTEANRQEFLNKIREAKVPASTCNTKQIKQANDLNRRDVLQKIDSQRQTTIALAKNNELIKAKAVTQETTFVNKSSITTSSASFQSSKQPIKAEKPLLLKKVDSMDNQKIEKTNTNDTVTNQSSTKPEESRRKEINNQDLIDKTIEGIINRVVSVKPQDIKPKVNDPKDIEQTMNELHGIPFVERPVHELPKVYKSDIKTYSKSDYTNLPSIKGSKIPIAVSQQKNIDVKNTIIDLDSEEEIIEHEPVTGDINLFKDNSAVKIQNAAISTMPHKRQTNVDLTKKETIITENEFDKFHRRNSVSFEDCYVNKKMSKSTKTDTATVKNILKPDQNVIENKTKISKPYPTYGSMQTNKLQMTSKLVPVDESMFNSHQSKLQLAYQTALTTKRQMESPITIIEDKPVKVVFMDSSTEYSLSKLNVQGPQLSPNKKQVHTKPPDTVTIYAGDSLDSDIQSIEPHDTTKIPDETKAKAKHQRKQVLTPVETPELELIVPGDLGIEVSPKKKRKLEDHTTKFDKNSKNVVPKKSYLLGRSIPSDSIIQQSLTKDAPKETDPANAVTSHSDAASAIDKLVKAAELIEKEDTMPIALENSPQIVTPVKRGRGRPRKHPLPDSVTSTPEETKSQTPQKSRFIDARHKRVSMSEDSTSSDGEIVKENWTMGKINENIVCPICNKLFRSENVVFKHVKHCTGPSPNRSESDRRSRCRSTFSHDSQSVESINDDSDADSDKPLAKKSTPNKRLSKASSADKNEEIVTNTTSFKNKKDKAVEDKKEIKKPIKTKAQYKVSALSCEYCGKSFRQLSYLVNHRLLHKQPNQKDSEVETQVPDKTVFSCEVCKKEFRKLHHLVQHRIIHNPSSASLKPCKRNSAEQIAKEAEEVKQNVDQTAAFRCEPCDKSFRKLHHLVEHRETHDGINRQKNVSSNQNTVEKTMSEPPPQCDVCKKTFRKLHHLIEHKEQHVETSSDKSDDKSVKSSLSTRDIIHECSLCYMVFPNEHSLTKHTVICQRKRRQSALKQSKQTEEAEKKLESKDETPENKIIIPQEPISVEIKEDSHVKTIENVDKSKQSTSQVDVAEKVGKLTDTKQQITNTDIKPVEQTPPPSKPINADHQEPQSVPNVTSNINQETQPKTKKDVVKPEEELKNSESAKKKTPLKTKEPITVVEKRRRSNLPLASIKETKNVESSDEDEIRYMLNPDYKETTKKENEPEDIFMKVKARKRNSLQFDKPKLKDTMKKRMPLQCLSKLHRVKLSGEENNDAQATTVTSTTPKIPKVEPAHSTDSDDSDVKYSFPEKTATSAETVKNIKVSKTQPKEKRKSLEDKRKILSGIAKRKSLGKMAAVKDTAAPAPAPVKEVKRRSGPAEHRCDCGQVFYSAALLARHTSLAHTPPRVRRVRAPPSPAPPAAPPAASTAASTARRRSAKPEPARASAYKRKTPAHRGVPVPEKMKKVMEKFKK